MDMRKGIAVLLAAGAVLLFASCATYEGEYVPKSEAELAAMEMQNGSAHAKFVAGKYAEAEAEYRALSSEMTVSQSLYHLELLSTLLLQGKQAEADELIARLYEEMETIWDPELEEKAMSIWHGETNKVFKGDAHEQTTFYMLMALSFIGRGNYEDAIRAVKNGVLADAESNSGDAVNDYGMLHYLGYVASLKLGQDDDAEEYLRRMQMSLEFRGYPGSSGEDNNITAVKKIIPNVLLIVWAGDPPIAVASGEYEELRCLVRGASAFDAMSVKVDSGEEYFAPNALADINYQATTRGGRVMDNVLETQANVKAGVETSAGILAVTGASLMQAGALTDDNSSPLGLILFCAGGTSYLLGAITEEIGSWMNAKADIRYWHNLPGEFYIVPLALSQGRHTVTLNGFRHSDRAGSKTITFDVAGGTIPQIVHAAMLKTTGDFSGNPSNRNATERARILEKALANRYSAEVK